MFQVAFDANFIQWLWWVGTRQSRSKYCVGSLV